MKADRSKKVRKVTKPISIYISGFGYKDRERRKRLCCLWSFQGGKVSYSRIRFDREVYEKGIESMEKEFSEKASRLAWDNFCYLTVKKQGWIDDKELADKIRKGKYYAYYKAALEEAKRTNQKVIRIDSLQEGGIEE